MDGVIQIRRGVKEPLARQQFLRPGSESPWSGTHYLKGMAVYSDDLPKGVDVVFNTGEEGHRSSAQG